MKELVQMLRNLLQRLEKVEIEDTRKIVELVNKVEQEVFKAERVVDKQIIDKHLEAEPPKVTIKLDETKEKIKKIVLDTLINNYNVNVEKRRKLSSPGNCSSNISGATDKLILKVMPKLFENTKLFDIIGIQVMVGPIGQCHVLCVKPPITVQILQHIVEARTMRMATRYTFEAAQDAQTSYGGDIENEIISAMANGYMVEIEQDILGKLRICSKYKYVCGAINYNQVKDNLLQFIEIETTDFPAEQVYCVISPDVFKHIKQYIEIDSNYKHPEPDSYLNYSMDYVGTFNDVKIYLDYYAKEGEVILGSKMSECDAPLIYGPYVIMDSTGVIIDPNTFEPIMAFTTRYGCLIPEKGRRKIKTLKINYGKEDTLAML